MITASEPAMYLERKETANDLLHLSIQWSRHLLLRIVYNYHGIARRLCGSMMTNALAFDIATCSGWALVHERENRGERDPEYQVLSAGVIAIPDLSLPRQMAYLGAAVKDVMEEVYHIVDFIIYEKVPAVYSGPTTVAFQNAQYGVFLSALAIYDVISIVDVAPPVWQRAMLDYIPNRKTFRRAVVRRMLKRDSIRQAWLRAGFETDDDNVADAVNIAIYGLRTARIRAAVSL